MKPHDPHFYGLSGCYSRKSHVRAGISPHPAPNRVKNYGYIMLEIINWRIVLVYLFSRQCFILIHSFFHISKSNKELRLNFLIVKKKIARNYSRGSYHNFMVVSTYSFLGSILIRDSVHTDREKVSTKASYYTDKHLK